MNKESIKAGRIMRLEALYIARAEYRKKVALTPEEVAVARQAARDAVPNK